eukprot:4171953-Prymnesium_polylepis.1
MAKVAKCSWIHDLTYAARHMISGISSQPPRWICPGKRQRASSTLQHAREAKIGAAHPPPRGTRPKRRAMQHAATNIHLDGI